MRTKTFLVVGVLVALFLAGVVSFYASSEPDGLDRAAKDTGLSATEKRHQSEDSPLAGYTTTGVDDPRLSTGLAGATGVLVVLALTAGLVFVVRRRSSDDNLASRDGGH